MQPQRLWILTLNVCVESKLYDHKSHIWKDPHTAMYCLVYIRYCEQFRPLRVRKLTFRYNIHNICGCIRLMCINLVTFIVSLDVPRSTKNSSTNSSTMLQNYLSNHILIFVHLYNILLISWHSGGCCSDTSQLFCSLSVQVNNGWLGEEWWWQQWWQQWWWQQWW